VKENNIILVLILAALVALKLRFFKRGKIEALEHVLFWLFSIKNHFYKLQKLKIEISMVFVLTFKNCFYPPKVILLKAIISTFWLS